MIHVVMIPDRLNNRVGEPEREDILHRLLTEVMVDPIDLVLVKDSMDHVVEASRALKVAPERLLENDPCPVSRTAVGVDQARRFEVVDDRWVKAGRGCEVEEAVAAAALLFVHLA